MLLLHQLCVPLPEALVETSVTWMLLLYQLCVPLPEALVET